MTTALKIESAQSAKSADTPRRFAPKRQPAVLRRHAPIATVGITEHQQTVASHEWISCPDCGKTFVAAAAVNGEIERVRDHPYGYSGPILTRRIYCDHCRHLIVWEQACNGDGVLCAEIGPHRTIKNIVTVERFLRDHPEAAGVEQS